MVIVHIDFTGTYNEEMNYQENLLPRMHVRQGHTVYFVSTCYRWNQGQEEKVCPGRYELQDGVHLIRMAYKHFGFEFLDKKLRAVAGIDKLLEELSPDVLMVHCTQTLACYPIMRYVKKHPNVKFYADTHTDSNNSAKTFLSREILHRFIYKPIVRKMQPLVGKFLCCTYECMMFMKKMYGITESALELFPLGGLLLEDEEYLLRRSRIRAQYNIGEQDIVLVHSGKMDEMKKTVELVRSFQASANKGIAKLFLIGSMDEYVKENVESSIAQGENVEYLGWKTGEELLDYLCACDLYCQPGSQSATMQNAACCRNALLLYPHQSYKYLMGNESVFWAETEGDMQGIFEQVLRTPNLLTKKRKQSYEIAKEKLDYDKLATRICS